MVTGAAGDWGALRVLPDGTVTFLLTDIEGSTRLWESAPTVMTEVVARHYEILDRAIAAHGGQRPQEQGEGDSVVGVFSDAADAVAAAVEAQRGLAAEPFAGSVSLRVRMALHSGVPAKRDALNYVGAVIIRCARLRACAHGGQIVVSNATAALARDRLDNDVSLVSLGQHRLKDLDVPEHVHQVLAPGLATAFAPLLSLQADKHNLPLQPTPLVGRGDEIAKLSDLLDRERAVTLTGSGGVGKTRLALQVAAEAVDRFEGGAWWVDLAMVTQSDNVAATVLAAVGGVQQAFASALDQLVTVLRPEAAVLVVLDNCEHVADGCASVVDALTTHCAGVTVLSTSREPLGVAGEITWRVASLSLPAGDTEVGLDDVAAYEALTLFWDQALRARPQLTLTNAMVSASVRICQRLDGIPLAIELAAARCRQLSPERIARELEEHYRLVAGSGRTQLPRQRTLETSVDWSHRLLDASEQLVFRRLGVFVGWFPLDAAEGIVSSFGDIDAWSVLDLVTRLADKSLLVVDDETGAGEPRYRMLETVRFFALERARAADELEALRESHATWWSDWITALDVRPYPRPSQASIVDSVYPNLRAALQWFTPTPERASGLVRSLAHWMLSRAHVEDLRSLLIPVARSLHATREPGWRGVAAALSLPALTLGDIDFVIGPVSDALAAAEEEGDEDDVAACLAGLAFVDPSPDTWARLGQCSEQAYDASYLIGRAAFHGLMPGDLREDRDALIGIVAAARQHANLHKQTALPALATVLLGLGEYQAVYRQCDELVVAMDEGGAAPAMRLWALAVDALAALDQGDAIRIEEFKERRNSRMLRGVPRFWAGAWEATIDIASHQLAGTPLDVESLVEVATSPLPSTPWRPGFTVIAQELADRGLAEPLRILIASLAASPLAAGPYHRMQTGAMRARLAHVDGDVVGEEAEWRSLLSLAVEQGARPTAIDALEAIAAGAALTAPARSMRILAAAQSARDSIAYRLRFPREQRRIDDAHAVIADALDPDRLATAQTEGAAMSIDEAAAYAQRTRGPRVRPTLGWESLTPTERNVAGLVAEGATNPDIARKLLMSVNTVKTHLAHIFTKLDINSRAELASLVTRHRD